MARALPIVSSGGKRWFLDMRLRELRNVKNPHEWVDFSEVDWEGLKVVEPGGEIGQKGGAEMLVRLVVDRDRAKSIVLEQEIARRVSDLLESLGHHVTWEQ